MIIFDASIFGAKHTGIWRYANELVWAIQASDPSLSLSIENFGAELCYLQSKERGILPYSQTLKTSVGGKSLDRISLLYESKGMREVQRTIRQFSKLALAPFSPKLSSHAEEAVYHSSYSPFHISERAGVTRVITIHDMIPFLYPHYFDEVTRKRHEAIVTCASEVEKVICDSESTANDLLCIAPHIAKEKLFTVPLAASEHFSPKRVVDREALLERYEIPKNQKILLSVCTLEPRKNLTAVIKVWKKIQQEHCDWVLVLVGGSGWGGVQGSIASEVDLRGVYMTGFVPDEDLYDFYTIANLFIYPSLYEGFGLPVLEAMQAGLPVVTSNNSSIPEVVGPDYPTVTPSEEGEIYALLDQLMSSESQRNELSMHGLERSREFSWVKVAEQTLAAYKY